MDIIESPLVPSGTVYVIPSDAFKFSDRPIRLVSDLWGPPPYAVGRSSDLATRERSRALDHLASLLDGLCESIGLDPDTTWREPRTAEERTRAMRRGELMYRAELLAALAVRPSSAFVITGIS